MTTCTRTYPGLPESVPAARSWAAGYLRAVVGEGAAGLLDDTLVCLSEYLTNALRYTRSGLPGGTVAIRIVVAAGAWLRIEVRDQGTPPDMCPAAGPGLGQGLRITGAGPHADGAVNSAAGRLSWFRIDWRPAPAPADRSAPAPEPASTSKPDPDHLAAREDPNDNHLEYSTRRLR
jgi:anti-sigma regulatory factor (Ser/Thr protein kinase)